MGLQFLFTVEQVGETEETQPQNVREANRNAHSDVVAGHKYNLPYKEKSPVQRITERVWGISLFVIVCILGKPYLYSFPIVRSKGAAEQLRNAAPP